MKKVSILILFSLLRFLSAASNTAITDHEADTNSCLVLSGKILNAGTGQEKGCLIEIFCNGAKVHSISLKGNKKSFYCGLELNKQYGIRITKKGFIPRLISVDTRKCDLNEDPHWFKFETFLIEESDRHSLNADAIDFPIAIISYDANQKLFKHNEEYTSYIKKEMNNPVPMKG